MTKTMTAAIVALVGISSVLSSAAAVDTREYLHGSNLVARNPHGFEKITYLPTGAELIAKNTAEGITFPFQTKTWDSFYGRRLPYLFKPALQFRVNENWGGRITNVVAWSGESVLVRFGDLPLNLETNGNFTIYENQGLYTVYPTLTGSEVLMTAAPISFSMEVIFGNGDQASRTIKFVSMSHGTKWFAI